MKIDLSEAIKRYGGRNKAATALGVTYQGLTDWLRRKVIPAERVLPLCGLCAWEVTPHQLRADLYPHPDDGLPQPLRGRRSVVGES